MNDNSRHCVVYNIIWYDYSIRRNNINVITTLCSLNFKDDFKNLNQLS